MTNLTTKKNELRAIAQEIKDIDSKLRELEKRSFVLNSSVESEVGDEFRGIIFDANLQSETIYCSRFELARSFKHLLIS